VHAERGLTGNMTVTVSASFVAIPFTQQVVDDLTSQSTNSIVLPCPGKYLIVMKCRCTGLTTAAPTGIGLRIVTPTRTYLHNHAVGAVDYEEPQMSVVVSTDAGNVTGGIRTFGGSGTYTMNDDNSTYLTATLIG